MLLPKTIEAAPWCSSAKSSENIFLMDVWRRLVVSFILGKWSFSVSSAAPPPLFLHHYFSFFLPQDARSWTLLLCKRLYGCSWNRLNKFSTLQSITSSQFHYIRPRFAHMRHWKNRSSERKKGKFRQNQECLGFAQIEICQSLFFFRNLIERCLTWWNFQLVSSSWQGWRD